MKYALLKMESGNADFNKHFFFNSWCGVVQDEKKLHDLAHMDSVSAQAARLKALRSADNRKLMFQIAEGNDGACVHVVFGTWREYTSDVRKEVEFDKKMSEKMANSYGGKHDIVMEKAMIKWAEGDITLLKHTVLKAWCDDVVAQREMDAQAAKIAEQQAIKKEHDQKMEYVLLKMEGDNKSFIQQYGFNAWRDYCQDKKRVAGGDEMQRQVELYREMHRADVRKLMYKLVSADANTAKHVVLMAWAEHTEAERKVRLHEKHVAAINSKNNGVIDKAVMRWGDSDKALMLQVVTFEWKQLVRDKKSFASAKNGFKATKQEQMAYMLSKMDGENVSFLKQYYVRAWHDMTESAKRELFLEAAQATASELRELRKQHSYKLMAKVAMGSDASKLHITFSKWADLVLTEKAMREIQAKHASDSRKQNSVLEKAMLKWDDNDKAFLKHTMFRAWADDAAQEMEGELRATQRQKHKADVHKTMNALICNEESTCRATMFIAWRQVVRDLSRDLEMKAHLNALRAGHDTLLEKTFGCWSKSKSIPALHVAYLHWDLALQKTRREAMRSEGSRFSDRDAQTLTEDLQDKFAVQLIEFEQDAWRTNEDFHKFGHTADEIQEQCRLQGFKMDELQAELDLLQSDLAAIVVHDQDGLILGGNTGRLEDEVSYQGKELADLERELALLQGQMG